MAVCSFKFTETYGSLIVIQIVQSLHTSAKIITHTYENKSVLSYIVFAGQRM